MAASRRAKKSDVPGSGIEKPESRKAARNRRRKRRWRIGLIVLVLLACAVFIVLSLTVLFRVAEYAVEGETEVYSQEEIVEASGIPTGINLFSVDTGAAAARIEAQLPYIAKAEVSIGLPDRIRIRVTAAEPVARIETDDGLMYLSESGKILGKAEKDGTGLLFEQVQVTNARPGYPAEYAREDTAQVISAVLQALNRVPMSRITGVDLSDLYGIVLHYGELYEIRVGSIADLSRKLDFADYVIQNKLDPEQPGTLDLSSGTDQAVFRPDYDSGGVIILPEKQDPSSEVSSTDSAA